VQAKYDVLLIHHEPLTHILGRSNIIVARPLQAILAHKDCANRDRSVEALPSSRRGCSSSLSGGLPYSRFARGANWSVLDQVPVDSQELERVVEWKLGVVYKEVSS
jgi:hypothetical protein